MTVSAIAVTEGVGKNLHSDARTISAVVREDQYVQQGEPAYPTYSVALTTLSVATTADHIVQLMGDGTNYCRLKEVKISQAALSAAASTVLIRLYRLSTAGTGGTAVTARPADEGDGAYAGGIMTLPTVKGTEGVLLWQWRLPLVAAQPMTGMVEWHARPDTKPFIWGTADTNGLAFKVITGIATTPTVDFACVFTVTSYL